MKTKYIDHASSVEIQLSSEYIRLLKKYVNNSSRLQLISVHGTLSTHNEHGQNCYIYQWDEHGETHSRIISQSEAAKIERQIRIQKELEDENQILKGDMNCIIEIVRPEVIDDYRRRNAREIQQIRAMYEGSWVFR